MGSPSPLAMCQSKWAYLANSLRLGQMVESLDLKSTSSGEVLSWVHTPRSFLWSSGWLQEHCGHVSAHATGQMSLDGYTLLLTAPGVEHQDGRKRHFLLLMSDCNFRSFATLLSSVTEGAKSKDRKAYRPRASWIRGRYSELFPGNFGGKCSVTASELKIFETFGLHSHCCTPSCEVSYHIYVFAIYS